MRNRNEIPKQTAANKAKITLSVGKLKAIIHQAYKQGERQAAYDLFGEVPIECGSDPFEVRKTYVRSVIALACIHGDVPDAPISTAYRDEMRAQVDAGTYERLPIEPKWPKRVFDLESYVTTGLHPPYGGEPITRPSGVTVFAVDEADADKQLRGVLDRMPNVEGITVDTMSLIHPGFGDGGVIVSDSLMDMIEALPRSKARDMTLTRSVGEELRKMALGMSTTKPAPIETEVEKVQRDVELLGVGYMYDGKRLDPRLVTLHMDGDA